MGLFRRRREDRPPPPGDPLAAIDRSQVPPHLQPVVDRAVQAAHRYRGLVAARPPGPVRDRLHALGPRVDAGVLAVIDAAARAGHVDDGTGRVPTLPTPRRATAAVP